MNKLTLPFFLNFLFRLGVDQDSIYGAVFGIKNIRVYQRHQRSADICLLDVFVCVHSSDGKLKLVLYHNIKYRIKP